MLVKFLVCGVQKGGTSALDQYLRMHPDISMASTKEVHFFDNESQFVNAAPDYNRYHSFFDPSKNNLLGESTPIYAYWQPSMKRIWQYNKDMKLILVLRNPISRAYSHWKMERIRGSEGLPFWDAITQERERCFQALPYQHRVFSYVDRGFYSEQIRRMRRFFPDENILVLNNDNLRRFPDITVNQVFNFLGARELKAIEPIEAHSRRYEVPMSDIERAYLQHIYSGEFEWIRSEFSWDFSN
jgi:hypothetical protein